MSWPLLIWAPSEAESGCCWFGLCVCLCVLQLWGVGSEKGVRRKVNVAQTRDGE